MLEVGGKDLRQEARRSVADDETKPGRIPAEAVAVAVRDSRQGQRLGSTSKQRSVASEAGRVGRHLSSRCKNSLLVVEKLQQGSGEGGNLGSIKLAGPIRL